MEKKKKIAAVIGVMKYLAEEKALFSRRDVYVPTLPVPWAMAGRQTMMQNRALMQRRVLKRG